MRMTQNTRLPVAIALLGLPGSGKGTVAHYFKDKGYEILTMSNILKEMEAHDEDFALKYKFSANNGKGNLVADEGIIKAFRWKISTIQGDINVVLDGCTRTPEQTHGIMNLMKSKYRMIFFHVTCSIRTSSKRIATRVKEHEEQGIPVRSDDKNKKAVRNRQKAFQDNIEGIYGVVNGAIYPIYVIDGEQSKEVVISRATTICPG